MLHDSIIVFTTDNGGPAAGFGQNAASNWPLRGVILFRNTWGVFDTLSATVKVDFTKAYLYLDSY